MDEHRQCTAASTKPLQCIVKLGSFGHFQASKSGVHKGGLSKPLVKSGFVATRISVTSLNLEIVRALAKEGIPSIGMSPFSCGWSTCERNIAIADISTVVKAIGTGFIPPHCMLLISEHICFSYTLLNVDRCFGAVHEDGSWSVLKPKLQDTSKQVEITVAAHDTTGGMITKISEAAVIAKLGIDVYIVKATTKHSVRALKGQLKENIPDDWLGTVIRLAK
ncbi:UNVERIFIED_CONTAM: Isopentenyl phosphate kinase [Sesamum calycinum]|uniref:Isopentenyl phosphate kinase n=1 Tax=Sesamum calycinum TaxID=2727403 RepID=A0AAW2PSI9_9LAMI